MEKKVTFDSSSFKISGGERVRSMEGAAKGRDRRRWQREGKGKGKGKGKVDDRGGERATEEAVDLIEESW